MASLKAKQDDLRRLMKERRENSRDQKSRIDSPFAKYNNSGQLLCTICNIQIKNNGLWACHVSGKLHKENALKKKKGTTEAILNVVPRTDEKRSEIQPPAVKKIKVDKSETPLPKSEPVKNVGKINLLDAYSSTSEDESETSHTESVSNVISNTSLPTDFFDAAPSCSNPSKEEQPPDEGKNPASVNSVETLPEGFFDDPVLDAKARNIEYKDPIEEEWEKYQKAIAEETNVSKTIIEEDLEESTLERDITEIDQQINLWEKAKNLQSLAEEASTNAPSTTEKGSSSGSTDDELEEDDLLDWRSKGVKRK